jgi:hypothetical protein
MTKGFPWAAKVRLVELICRGASSRSASGEIGVSAPSALEWWRRAAVTELQLVSDGVGGLRGSWPGDVVGERTVRGALSIEERSAIATGCFHKRSVTAIAASIGPDKSVISRETRRNRSPDGVYRAAIAHRAAAARRARPKLISQMLCAESDRDTELAAGDTFEAQRAGLGAVFVTFD